MTIRTPHFFFIHFHSAQTHPTNYTIPKIQNQNSLSQQLIKSLITYCTTHTIYVHHALRAHASENYLFFKWVASGGKASFCRQCKMCPSGMARKRQRASVIRAKGPEKCSRTLPEHIDATRAQKTLNMRRKVASKSSWRGTLRCAFGLRPRSGFSGRGRSERRANFRFRVLQFREKIYFRTANREFSLQFGNF